MYFELVISYVKLNFILFKRRKYIILYYILYFNIGIKSFLWKNSKFWIHYETGEMAKWNLKKYRQSCTRVSLNKIIALDEYLNVWNLFKCITNNYHFVSNKNSKFYKKSLTVIHLPSRDTKLTKDRSCWIRQTSSCKSTSKIKVFIDYKKKFSIVEKVKYRY